MYLKLYWILFAISQHHIQVVLGAVLAGSGVVLISLLVVCLLARYIISILI